MNKLQTSLKRLQLAFKDTWGKSIDEQTEQLKLLQKLYNQNGLTIVRTCFACPEQYDIFKGEQKVAYYRLRHGNFTVDYPDCGQTEILSEYPNGDGIFDCDERFIYMIKALRKLLTVHHA